MEPVNYQELLTILKNRFLGNQNRHADIKWETIDGRLRDHPDALIVLAQMEKTGGEPDVIDQDAETGKVVFCDCAPESPIGRRSLCYDLQAFESRKKNRPEGSAMGMAASMGIQVLTEEEYRCLQRFGEFDIKTSSWVQTPEDVRSLGGALFCDRRYEKVFVYHNGADSYYSSRGFRGRLEV